MKISSGDLAPPPEPSSKAWSCLVTNLLVLPGLGSVMAGRKSGYIQILISLAGFVTTLAALVRIVLIWAQEFQLPDDHRLYVAAITGILVFLFSWCWSLLTSLTLFRKKE